MEQTDVRARVSQDLKGAAELMKDADRIMSKVFTERKHMLYEIDRLKNRVREVEAENRKLRKWRTVGETIDRAIKEADGNGNALRTDRSVSGD